MRLFLRIPVPFRRNEAIPADSGTIPADSGAILPDSGGFRRNYRNPDRICGAPKSTAHIPQKRGGARGQVSVNGWEGVEVSGRWVVVEE
jgi:hypothetical protein